MSMPPPGEIGPGPHNGDNFKVMPPIQSPVPPPDLLEPHHTGFGSDIFDIDLNLNMVPPGEGRKQAPPGAIPAQPGGDPLYLLRAEVQDLHSVMNNIRAGLTSLASNAPNIARTMADCAVIMQRIADNELTRSLHNMWEQMQNNPILIKPASSISAQEQLHWLNLLDQQIARVEYLIGYITIPARLNKWLALARPGYYIPFHNVFEDEIPSVEDRTRILKYLAFSPEAIRGGILDPNSGLIYRYAEDPNVRRKSLAILGLTLLLSIGLVVLACYLPLAGWPFQSGNMTTLLGGWAAILLGVIVHIAIGSLKRQQLMGDLPRILAIGDLPLLIDARIGTILQKLLLVLIALFGLAFSVGINNITPLNTFLVGYSLDSVVELFGNSLEKQAQNQLGILKKELSQD